MPQSEEIIVAVIGNPNVGKSTLFNELTGGKQYIGNWPGVTVERKEGKYRFNNHTIKLVDLPGTYTLGAFSIDEKVARDYIIEGEANVVLDIIDATNLERNLYLLIELLESGANVVVALNMFDLIESMGMTIDIKKLEKTFGVPFIPTAAVKGQGLLELSKALIEAAKSPKKHQKIIDYGSEIEVAIEEILRHLTKLEELTINPRWIAIKLLEGDLDVIERCRKMCGDEIVKLARNLRNEIWKKLGKPPTYIIAEKRYRFIDEILQEVIIKKPEEKPTVTDAIDQVITHKYLSIPIFIALLWGMFKFTFDVAAPLVDGIDILFGLLADYTRSSIGIEWLASLLADGIIGGLGSVLVFIPNIFFLFLAMALLEDVGYMARAAFNFDRLMKKIGLHGRSIIPMVLGMGCNVPAIMSARTIESEEDRLVTILINPLIPCSARFPVFIMLAAIFFSEYEAIAVLSMYFIGFLLAAIIAILLRKLVFKGKYSPLTIELPPYRLPSGKSLGIHMWNRGVHFLKKAGIIIFSMTIVMWMLFYLPPGTEMGGPNSYAGILGRMIEPLVRPLGFDWRIAVALIFGFIAKEVVIDAFGIMFGGQLELLTTVLTPVSAFALMAFILIYTPCMATLATVKSETGSWKWTIFTVIYELLLAYSVAYLIVTLGALIY